MKSDKQRIRVLDRKIKKLQRAAGKRDKKMGVREKLLRHRSDVYMERASDFEWGTSKRDYYEHKSQVLDRRARELRSDRIRMNEMYDKRIAAYAEEQANLELNVRE